MYSKADRSQLSLTYGSKIRWLSDRNWNKNQWAKLIDKTVMKFANSVSWMGNIMLITKVKIEVTNKACQINTVLSTYRYALYKPRVSYSTTAKTVCLVPLYLYLCTSDASTIRLLDIFQTSDNLSLNVERDSQLVKAAFCNSKACIFHLAQITWDRKTTEMYEPCTCSMCNYTYIICYSQKFRDAFSFVGCLHTVCASARRACRPQ